MGECQIILTPRENKYGTDNTCQRHDDLCGQKRDQGGTARDDRLRFIEEIKQACRHDPKVAIQRQRCGCFIWAEDLLVNEFDGIRGTRVCGFSSFHSITIR